MSVPCAARVGPRPDYPDGDDALRAAPDLLERVKLLLGPWSGCRGCTWRGSGSAGAQPARYRRAAWQIGTSLAFR